LAGIEAAGAVAVADSVVCIDTGCATAEGRRIHHLPVAKWTTMMMEPVAVMTMMTMRLVAPATPTIPAAPTTPEAARSRVAEHNGLFARIDILL